MSDQLQQAPDDGDFHKTLTSSVAGDLLVHDGDNAEGSAISLEDIWSRNIDRCVASLSTQDLTKLCNELFIVGCAALHAFLQSNVTGPTLSWNSATTIIPQTLRKSPIQTRDFHARLIASLTVDGEAVYKLIPNVELFCLAKCILNHPYLESNATEERLRFRIRVNFWHQRMLSDIAPTLQAVIFRDLDLLEEKLQHDAQLRAEFLIERATIHTHHGSDVKARNDLAEASRLRKFDFALTGRLGKRTKFQQKELSQLVVLAKSAENNESNGTTSDEHDRDLATRKNGDTIAKPSRPLEYPLNNDTLLESISFSKGLNAPAIQDEEQLPPSLMNLDPADQPRLDPLDSIILLATASSITNTSPQDGLTREETLPYATRVLEGGSTNWQIFTQALIVRSRIEGHKSRTTERGLLQLQAIVDQVIAETTSDPSLEADHAGQGNTEPSATNFIPQPKPSESAPVTERLRYIHLLASPTRWKLESELADRWVSLGGLRTALEIYERLEMWAEVALCWAAQDREDKARNIIRRQLYVLPSTAHDEESSTVSDIGVNGVENLKERDPLPNDAPRLFCILGDIEKSPAAYRRAWEASNRRYARAQRSLGRHYFAQNELQKADEAYSLSLKINPQNHSIWFALGCVRLQLEDWTGAIDAFTRAVQIEEKDAESWSNLAAALLRLEPDTSTTSRTRQDLLDGDEDEADPTQKPNPQQPPHAAYLVLKRAAALKRDSYRIWQNLIHVAVQLSPPPYTDIIIAQTRLIDLLAKTEGEKCVDVPIVEGLVAHLIATSPSPSSNPNSDTNIESEATHKRPGFEKMVIELVQKKITPLITTSRRLWLLTAKLALYLQHPFAALSAYEKAWRVTQNQPGWESGTQASQRLWSEVTEATVELIDAYESLGEKTREKEAGMSAGEMVAKDWKFKARSAVRSVLGRAREGWEESSEWDRLQNRGEELRG